MPPKKKVARKTGSKSIQGETKIYRCTCCGKEETNPDGKFYKLSYSPTHTGNDNYAHICINCIKEIFERYSKKYSLEFATKVVCAELNVPYYRSLFESINKARDDFSFGYYVRQINGRQYQGHTFALTLSNGELERSKRDAEEEADKYIEANWSIDERRAKSEVIKLLGYDPFEGYTNKFRKKLFLDLIGYLDDEEILSDNYKLTQIIQIINNNLQIGLYDLSISKLDPKLDVNDIKVLNNLKKELVTNNEKIAKENGISVKSRGVQKTGKGSLTGLMRDMREKSIEEAEVNFYDQLQSNNTKWAVEISMQSLKDNCSFDENDVNDILEYQRSQLSIITNERDDLKEDKRILKKNEYDYQQRIKKLEEQIKSLGGEVDYGIEE